MRFFIKKFRLRKKKFLTIGDFYDYLVLNKEKISKKMSNLFYCLYIKRKRSSNLITLTNSRGEVVRMFSSGMFSRVTKRGKKMRKSLYSFKKLLAYFVKWYLRFCSTRKPVNRGRLNRRKRWVAGGLLEHVYLQQPGQLRAHRHFRKLFKRANILVRRIGILVKRPHSKALKTKKVRRL